MPGRLRSRRASSASGPTALHLHSPRSAMPMPGGSSDLPVERSDVRRRYAPCFCSVSCKPTPLPQTVCCASMSRASSVRPAGKVYCDAIAQRGIGCLARSTDRAQRPLDEVWRPRKADAPLLLIRQRPRGDARDVPVRVHQPERIERCARWLVQALRRNQTGRDDAIAEQRVLLDRKAMAVGEGNDVPRRRPRVQRHRDQGTTGAPPALAGLL